MEGSAGPPAAGESRIHRRAEDYSPPHTHNFGHAHDQSVIHVTQTDKSSSQRHHHAHTIISHNLTFPSSGRRLPTGSPPASPAARPQATPTQRRTHGSTPPPPRITQIQPVPDKTRRPNGQTGREAPSPFQGPPPERSAAVFRCGGHITAAQAEEAQNSSIIRTHTRTSLTSHRTRTAPPPLRLHRSRASCRLGSHRRAPVTSTDAVTTAGSRDHANTTRNHKHHSPCPLGQNAASITRDTRHWPTAHTRPPSNSARRA